MTSINILPQTALATTHFFDKIPVNIVTEKLPHKITISLVAQQDNKIAAIWQVAINDTLLKLDGKLFTLEGLKRISFAQAYSRMMLLTATTTNNQQERFVIWCSNDLGSPFMVARDAQVRSSNS